MFDIDLPVRIDHERVGAAALKETLERLLAEAFSGYVEASVGATSYFLFLDSGFPVSAGKVREGKEADLNPKAAVEELERALRFTRGTLSAYELSSELVPVMCGYFGAERVHSDLPAQFLTPKSLTQSLEEQRFTGFVRSRGAPTVLLFYSVGTPVGAFVGGKRSPLPEAVGALDVSSVEMFSTETSIARESEAVRDYTLLAGLEQLYDTVLKEVRRTNDGEVGPFLLVLRESVLVMSDEVPLLNPFLGLVKFTERKVELSDELDAAEVIPALALAIVRTLQVFFTDHRDYRRIYKRVEPVLRSLGVS